MISKQQVQHIAKLARLGLTEKEIEKYKKELSSILDYIANLKEVNLSGVEPSSHPHLLENVFREDEPKPENSQRVNKIIEMAPKRERGYIKVKQIL